MGVPESIVGESAWLDSIWSARDRLKSVPALFIWGMKVDAFAPLLPRWEEAFADGRAVRLGGRRPQCRRRGRRSPHPPIEDFLAQKSL